MKQSYTTHMLMVYAMRPIYGLWMSMVQRGMVYDFTHKGIT